MKLKTREQRKQSRKKVVGTDATIQTYRITAKLECGHTRSFPIAAHRFRAGERGPKTLECYECGDALAQTTKGTT